MLACPWIDIQEGEQMNLENPTNTPDVQSTGQGGGQGVSTPANTPSSSSGQGSNTQSVDYSKQFEEVKTSYANAQQKINEQGNTIAQLNKQLEDFNRQQEAYKLQMGRALGLVKDEQEQNSIASLLYEDPEKAIVTVAERLANEKLAPIQQELEYTRVEKTLQQQLNEQKRFLQEQSEKFTPDVINKVQDNVGLQIRQVNPRISQLEAAMQTPGLARNEQERLVFEFNKEVVNTVNQFGGYAALAKLALGDMITNNYSTVMQSAALANKQKSISAGRGFTPGGYMGGAPISNQNQTPTGYNSQSTYR